MFAPRLTLALLLLPATLQAYAPYNTPTATADALNSPTTATGTYYSIELQDVTVNGLTCTGNLAIYKTIAGSVTNLGGMAVPCKDGMTWRITRNPNFIFISNDLGLFWYTNDADIATGQPGFGARNLNTAAGNGFASVTLWNFDQTPWNPVNTASIATSVAANEVDFQWQNATTPVGICGYQTYRNGVFMGGTSPGPTLVDHSVSPNGATSNVAYTNWSGGTPATRVTTSDTSATTKRWTRETLDGFGRTVKVETGYTTNNGAPTILGQSESVYAPCGCTPMEKLKQTSATHAPGATVYWTVYTYEALGRTLTVSQPNNLGQTTYAYVGNTVTVTDAAGKWKAFTTDAMGNLTAVTEPNPKGGANYNTYYTYNTFNQLLTVSMTRPKVPADGTNVTQTRTFVYDGNQRVQSVTNPENGTTSFTYNADGTMNTKTDAKNQTLAYAYDSLGRLTQVSSAGTTLRTFTYDANGWGQNLNGRVARVDYGGGKWSELYSYHAAGGRTAKRLTYSASSYTQNLDAYWTYNIAGQVTSVKYPDTTALDNASNPVTVAGDTYTYAFDPMGRPVTLTKVPGDGSASSLTVQNVTYGPSGELTAISYLGITETRSYNARMQLTTIGASNGTGFLASIG